MTVASDDFSLDMTKIKKVFSRKKGNKEEPKKDDFIVDVSSAKKIFSNKAVISTVLILVAIFFSIYFRAYPYSLPITDNWAQDSVYRSIRSQIEGDINKQYPNLPATNKNQLIDKQLAQVVQQQASLINEQTKSLSAQFKQQFQDPSGQTYLLAIDPYVFFTQTRNLLDHDYIGDRLVDGKSYNDHVLAPIGGFTKDSLHPFFEAYWHRFLSLFGERSLMSSIFFVPILLSALSVIPAFFIAKKRIGLFGGFVAAMIVAIHPSFIGRTAGGFADTDAYNVLFPLLIAWLFIEGFEAKNLKKQALLLSLSGLFIGIYSFAWTGWWYIFDFLVGVILIYLGYEIVRSIFQRKKLSELWSGAFKNSVMIFALFLVMSGVFVTLISGFSTFHNALEGPLAFRVIKEASKPDLWPNVYTTVAELNPASISSVIDQNGGRFLFFLGCLGIVLSMIKRDNLKKKDLVTVGVGIVIYTLLISNAFIDISPVKYVLIFLIPIVVGLVMLINDNRGVDVKYALFLSIWFVGTIYASTKGTRFVLLMVPAFGIAFGIALGMVLYILSNFISKELSINKKAVSVVLIMLLLILFISPVRTAHATGMGEVPTMNDGWWTALTKIKNETDKKTIITSWWDFGHWFKAIADRPVTFDGGSQNRPQAHWVGKLLMSDDEKLSMAILRMLDCGANTLFEKINRKYNDTETSVDMVYSIIMMSRSDAKSYLLERGFSDAEDILAYSHCEPPNAVLITSGDMVGKAGVWAHFGSWDFDKAFIYNTIKNKKYSEAVKMLEGRFNITEDEASNYYYDVQSLTSDRDANNWISPWPSYATYGWKSCQEEKNISMCSLNIGIGKSNQGHSVSITASFINLTNPSDTFFVMSFIDPVSGLEVTNQRGAPYHVVIAGDEIKKYDVGKDFNLDLVYDAVNKRALVSDPVLSESTFTKLFYLDGRYTSHFEKFSDITDVSGSRIITWKVLW